MIVLSALKVKNNEKNVLKYQTLHTKEMHKIH